MPIDHVSRIRTITLKQKTAIRRFFVLTAWLERLPDILEKFGQQIRNYLGIYSYRKYIPLFKRKEGHVLAHPSPQKTLCNNIDRDFLISFRKKRAARNTRVKSLLSHDSRSEEGQNDPKLLRSFKYLPEKYNFKSTIDIYDDKIVIIGPEVKALAVVVAIPAMVDVFRSVFEMLWEVTV